MASKRSLVSNPSVPTCVVLFFMSKILVTRLHVTSGFLKHQRWVLSYFPVCWLSSEFCTDGGFSTIPILAKAITFLLVYLKARDSMPRVVSNVNVQGWVAKLNRINAETQFIMVCKYSNTAVSMMRSALACPYEAIYFTQPVLLLLLSAACPTSSRFAVCCHALPS